MKWSLDGSNDCPEINTQTVFSYEQTMELMPYLEIAPKFVDRSNWTQGVPQFENLENGFAGSVFLGVSQGLQSNRSFISRFVFDNGYQRYYFSTCIVSILIRPNEGGHWVMKAESLPFFFMDVDTLRLPPGIFNRQDLFENVKREFIGGLIDMLKCFEQKEYLTLDQWGIEPTGSISGKVVREIISGVERVLKGKCTGCSGPSDCDTDIGPKE